MAKNGYGYSKFDCISVMNEQFRDNCTEIYGLGPSYFYSAPGLAWQACLKKTCKIRIIN